MNASTQLLKAGSVPERIGRYEIVRELASGGMGRIYLARPASSLPGFEQWVALKVVHPHLVEDRKFVEMFIDEARITAVASHPNICRLFEADVEDGTPYFVMEYLTGQPLSDLVTRAARKGFRDTEEYCAAVVRVCVDICEGLHAAHELRGADGELLHVVHRDVSPANLFITYGGVAKLLDFGVAQSAGRLHQTQSNVAKGKLAYMSPEQINGRPVDRRTDIWALGVSLWEALTCRRLFVGLSPGATVKSVMSGTIVSPSSIAPGVPRALSAVVHRALARDKDSRFATAREMGRELEHCLTEHLPPFGVADVSELMSQHFAKEREEESALRRRLAVQVPAASEAAVSAIVPIRQRRRQLTQWAVGAAVVLIAVSGWVWAALKSPGAVQPDSPPASPTSMAAAPLNPEVAAEPPAPTHEELTPQAVAENPENVPEMVFEQPEQNDDAPTARRRVVRPKHELRIVTPGGWAEVKVDGRSYGRTPTSIDLRAGTHRIQLRPFGQGPTVRRNVNLRRNDRLVVPVSP